MNLWINRLLADARLPEEDRLTRTNIPVGMGQLGERHEALA